MTNNTEVKNYQNVLKRKLEENPNDVEVLIQLGVLDFEHFHESEKALDYLKKAVEIDPLHVKAKFWLARCLCYDFFEYDQANQVLYDALRLDPNNPECLILTAWIISENDGPAEQAIEFLKKALVNAPEWPMLRYHLAWLYLAIGDISAAEEEIVKAFQIPTLDPARITNEVERYYESTITGRSWDDEKKKSSHIVYRLNLAKQNNIQNGTESF